MTEVEWNACTDPLRMLDQPAARRSGRKLRLFACAVCRRLWHLLRDERSRATVEVAERFADGLAGGEELAAAAREAGLAADQAERSRAPGWNAARTAALAAGEAWAAAARAAQSGAYDAELLREVLGNPIRPPAADPAWRTPVVLAIARSAYAERRFADLPVLGDALEDAGCTSAEVLAHLRGPGLHVRGCWALDLVLDKE
jgi:hypothetical protein